jgi:hypothetical protein
MAAQIAAGHRGRTAIVNDDLFSRARRRASVIVAQPRDCVAAQRQNLLEVAAGSEGCYSIGVVVQVGEGATSSAVDWRAALTHGGLAGPGAGRSATLSVSNPKRPTLYSPLL